jgi:putative transposase
MTTPQSSSRHRRSIRLPGYDYSSEGLYFVTIVTHERESLFGNILDGEMCLNPLGDIVREEWLRSPQIRAEIELDEFVIMPNHFHAIFSIIRTGDRPVAPTTNPVTNTTMPVAPTKQPGPPPKSVGSFIAGFKSSVTKRINLLRHTPGLPVWQRNYYEHIIGTDREYDQIAEYIFSNPQNWQSDSEYFQP